MRLKFHVLAGLAFTTALSATLTAPALADHLPNAISQDTTKTETTSAEEAVSRVREVYSKICSERKQAELPARQSIVPQPVPVAIPAPTVTPQMW